MLWSMLFLITLLHYNYICISYEYIYELKIWVKLYFKVSLLQCNYTFKYWVILINYMHLLYG